MVVRIRFGAGPGTREQSRRHQQVALALASLLMPVAVMAYVLAGWELTASWNLIGSSPIASGFFSHWPVWLAAAAILHLSARLLNDYGKAGRSVRKAVDEPTRESQTVQS